MSVASPPAQPNVPEWTVGELSQRLKRAVEDGFGRVRVRGEVSQPKRAASGHIYMTLKDESAVLDAVCWRGTAERLSVQPEEGMEVVCTGRLTTYPGRSKYQMIVEAVELAGEGALLKLLEERRRKLAAEGLFAAERKRALPYLPAVVGVVTSPTGAVIRDILHRLSDRFPVHVLVWPVLVQGEQAAAQVAAAIAGFNRLAPGGPLPRPDVLIIARGGGSLEDLWAFNEEVVVRATAASAIPLISAVGHETDTTLIDFAADRRAPTPTAAAEMAVPVRAELIAQILDHAGRLVSATERRLREARTRVEGLGRGIGDPLARINHELQRVDDVAERLRGCFTLSMERRERRLAELGHRLPSPAEQIARAASRLAGEARALAGAWSARSAAAGHDLRRCAERLSPRPILERLARGGRDVERLADGLVRCGHRRLADAASRLAACGSLLESLSFVRVLERGFALVRDEAGRPVTRAAAARPGQTVRVQFADGTLGARLAGESRGERAAALPAPGRQGRLL